MQRLQSSGFGRVVRASLLAVALLGFWSGAAFAQTGGWVALGVGTTHACGLSETGRAYCWGFNLWGQVGNGRIEGGSEDRGIIAGPEDYLPSRGGSIPIPTAVMGDLVFDTLVVGGVHTCGLTSAGEAHCWGQGSVGQLGDGARAHSGAPVRVAGGLRFTSLTAGGWHTCGLIAEGTAYCWGGNWHGQLGMGMLGTRSEPVPVAGEHRFRSISAGATHTCALTLEGRAYCWGDWRDGRLGTIPPDQRDSPLPLAAEAGPFASITAGGNHTCGVGLNGVARCWGRNRDGQLNGKPEEEFVAAPGAIADGATLARVFAGVTHSCGLSGAGELHCWGSNRFGALDGSGFAGQVGWRAVLPGVRFRDVSLAGSVLTSQSCGLTADAEILCWGSNQYGQLGDGAGSDRAGPVRVLRP